MAPHLFRRLDAVVSKLHMDRSEAVRTAVVMWLEEAERNAACHDRMLKVRATMGRASRIA